MDSDNLSPWEIHFGPHAVVSVVVVVVGVALLVTEVL